MPKKTNKEKKIKGKAGAPKGNKNAVGHGRPPTPGFDDESCIQLGEELLAWMREVDSLPEKQRNKIVHLSQWFSEIKGISRTQWQSIIIRDCFKNYNERAQMWMGTRMILNSDLPTAYGCRFQKIYFKDVATQEREDVEHKIDYEISKKITLESNRSIPPNDTTLTDLLSEIKQLKDKVNATQSETNSEF